MALTDAQPTDASLDSPPDTNLPDASVPDADVPPAEYAVAQRDTTIRYMTAPPAPLTATMRELTLRVYYPLEFTEAARLILVSHGGQGSMRGHMAHGHLGNHYASRGYVAVHIGHRPSENVSAHRWDRPHDVSATLDVISRGEVTFPADFEGRIQTDEVGHIGHSWGAYTAHAVAGGRFLNPLADDAYWDFRDERVVAMAALSPQGSGGFGAYDTELDWQMESADNTWRVIEIPTFTLIGEAEMNGVAGIESGMCADCFRGENWRLFPYLRSPSDGQRHTSIIAGGTHSDLGSGGSADIKRYLAFNTRIFFDIYLRGDTSEREALGNAEAVADIEYREK